MSHVIFSYTRPREKAYQQKLLAQQQWFIDNDFPVLLPKHATQTTLNRRAKMIKQKLPSLQRKWDKIEHDYFNVVESFKHVKLLPKYVCHVTSYGPEGEFQAPNILFVRLKTVRDNKLLLETIGHELIHICLGEFFDKKKFGYAEVEWLVDNIILQSALCQLFTDYKQQSVGTPRPEVLDEIIGHMRIH